MNKITISYLTMRKIIGIVAIAFPILLILGALMSGYAPMQPSLSQYYWTTSGDIFVGMLVTFGIFLLAYNGYDKKDRALTMIAGIAMLFVAFFPCEGSDTANYLFTFLTPKITAMVHYSMAITTFSFMGFMLFFQFTKTKGNLSNNKVKRNKIYKISAIIIWASILCMGIVKLIPGVFEATNSFRLFFWLESIVLWAFGTSWLVKGEVILKDI